MKEEISDFLKFAYGKRKVCDVSEAFEEFPVEEGDPKPPATGDNSNIGLWIAVMVISLATIIILLVWRKKNKENVEKISKSDKKD